MWVSFFQFKKKLPSRKLSPVKVVNKIFKMCTIRFLNSEQGVHDTWLGSLYAVFTKIG